MRLLFLLLIAVTGYVGEITAQDLLKDINSTSPIGSNPQYLTAAGGNLFFAAYGDPELGTELWKTDGISVSLVANINPGPAGTNNSSSPKRMAAFQDKVYFVADDGVHGDELWVSDGSEGGTYLVKDIYPGAFDGDPLNLTPGSDWLYFTVEDGINGRELWRTNGTTEGTVLVKDILTGIGDSNPSGLTMWNGILFFSANEVGTGRELWRSEGTTADTRRVRDLYPGVSDANPSSLTVFKDKLFFVAKRNNYSGPGLFMTSGDSISTNIVKHFGIQSNNPRDLIVVNNTLFFWVNGTPGGPVYLGNELWKSDGTFGGTTLVKDIYPGSSGSVDFTSGIEKAILGNQLVFVANDGVHGYQLWISDGTMPGTHIIEETGFPRVLRTVGNSVFFQAHTPDHKGLWKTDGTAAGTIPVRDFSLSPPTFLIAGYIQEAIAFNGQYFFTGDPDLKGLELWRSNGTEAGTVEVSDIRQETASSTITGFVPSGNYLFFSANDGVHGQELWRTDGTSEGTIMLSDILPGYQSSNPSELTQVGDWIFFYAVDTISIKALWKSDGTPEGTERLKGFTQVRYLVAMNGILYFGADEGPTGLELWRSDGTPAGTVLLKDIDSNPFTDGFCSYNAPVGGSNPIVAFNGRLLFCGGGELWVSDGTPEGTTFLQDLNPEGGANPDNFYPLGDKVFFVAGNENYDRELWKTNGLPGGTINVYNFTGIFVGISHPFGFFDANNLLFLTTWDTYEYEEWVTDGNVFGTKKRENFLTNMIPYGPVVETGSDFFFPGTAKDGSTGLELWKGPLTPGSTATLVKDIVPGAGDSDLGYLTLADSSLFFFTADDGVHGVELWHSDGTPSGTLMQKDIYPGTLASNPYYLFVWNNALYFVANEFDHGIELWKYAFSPLPVTWLEFNGEQIGKDIRLFWQTASEHNNRGFEIQRLNASGRWINLDFVEGAGNTDQVSNYVYFDRQPQPGTNYYRLRQVDWDGKADYSRVVSVEMPGIAVRVYPNPGPGVFYLQAPEYQEDLEVNVFDSTGRPVSVQFLRSGEYRLDLQSFPAGIYLIQIKTGEEVMMMKVLKE